VLFLCTHNSARSQMAEAILRHLGGADFEVQSAGTRPSRVHPLAVRTMAARGLDLREHRSKGIADLASRPFDFVVTVCDAANDACPILPGDHQRLHWSIDDPSSVEGSEADRLAAFERAAEKLEARIGQLIEMVRSAPPRA
jgi:arsenate reductase